MGFLVMMVLFFAFMRFGRLAHMRRWQCGAHLAYGGRRSHDLRTGTRAAEPPTPGVSAFETLKDRYVRGAISDAQYESELDRLLRTPEGRSFIS